MELLCPHCFKRVTVPNEKAGQPFDCPLCGKRFAAPALTQTSPTVAPPRLPIPPPTPVSVAPPTPAASSVAKPETLPKPEVPPRPAPLPGTYQHALTFRFRHDVLAWVAPACLLLIFCLTFLDWHYEEQTGSETLWGLAFGQNSFARFTAYVLFTVFLALPLAAALVVLDKVPIALPPPVAEWSAWKGLPLTLVLGFGWLLLFADYIAHHSLLGARTNPIMLPMKLAFYLQLLALLAASLEFWLALRRSWNLPEPKVEMRW